MMRPPTTVVGINSPGGGTAEPVSPRFQWAELALGAASLTVVATTALSVLGVPEWIQRITFLGIGAAVQDTDKAWVAVLWLSAAATTTICVLLDRHRARVARSRALSRLVTAISLVAFGMTWLLATWKDPESPPTWTGYGVIPVMVGSLLAVLILVAVTSRTLNGRALMTLSIALMVVMGLPHLLQTPNTFAWNNGYDNQFTLDEILAPSIGRMPGFDYVAQYDSLLGYPLALAALALPGLFVLAPEVFAISWLTLLQIATLAIAVIAVIRVTPSQVRWLVPLIVVPMAYLVGSAGLEYYADLPLRFVLPAVLLLALSWRRISSIGSGHPWWGAMVLGALGGAAALNNLDFGVPAVLAGLIAVTISGRRLREMLRLIGLYLAGSVLAPLVYLAIGYATGRAYHLEYALFFVQSFGVGGHLNVDMAPIGLHLCFVFLGVIGLVLGVLGVRRLRGRSRVLHQMMVFQSSWLLLSLVYFSGRSLLPTLITGSIFQAGVLLALLFAGGFLQFQLLRRAGVSVWGHRDWMTAALVVLSLGLPLASIAWFPTPLEAAARLENALRPSVPAYLQPDPSGALAELPDRDQMVGILSVSSAVWSTRIGVPNANLFLHPDYLAFSGAADLECAYLDQLPGQTLLTRPTDLQTLQQSASCRKILDFDSERPIATSSNSPTWVLVDKFRGEGSSGE